VLEHTWQKSSFSTGPDNNCVYVAAGPAGHVRLRESSEPDIHLIARVPGLAALLARLKTSSAQRPQS
jgi:Domain of unknown function (DUF397)